MIIQLLGSNLNRLGSLWRLNKTVVFILTFLESISQDKMQIYKWIFKIFTTQRHHLNCISEFK